MFHSVESEISGIRYTDYLSDVRDVHTCDHHFVKKGPKVECTKCGVGYHDNPKDPFPIEEMNDFYSNRKNNAYFKENTP